MLAVHGNQGVTFTEFKEFCQFLNNLDDFALAMRIYTYASQPISESMTHTQPLSLSLSLCLSVCLSLFNCTSACNSTRLQLSLLAVRTRQSFQDTLLCVCESMLLKENW